MESCDNRTFDLRCVDIDVALDVAMGDRRVTHYLEHHNADGDGRLVFYWTRPTTVSLAVRALPGRGLTPVGVTALIDAWQETVDYPPMPDIDGDCIKSLRVFNGPAYDFVDGYGHESLFAVEPWWAMYGK